jgi:predicted transcriptional regulator
MKVKEIMSREINFINTNNTIQEAAEKMKEKNLGVLPVLGNEKAVGFITYRDIAARIVAKGLDTKTAVVSDAMSEKILACREDDTVEDAFRLMSTHRIPRLAVIDENQTMTGLVSLWNLAAQIHMSTSQ